MSTAPARKTLHLARADDAPLLIERFKGESEQHYTARRASIVLLGTRWVRHPQYRFEPIHSTNPEVWKPAHAQWWEQVHADAKATRERNPAFKRAQAVRAAVGDR